MSNANNLDQQQDPHTSKAPVKKTILARRSTYSFADRAIPENELRGLFSMARWAASSYNEQPWRFVVADRFQNPEDFDNLADCLSEGNRKWAPKAAVLCLAVAKRHFTRNGKPNRHAWYDTGQAVSTLMMRATELGIVGHQMAGFSSEKARMELNIPPEFEPVTMIALGYPGKPEKLSEELQQREGRTRRRREVEEIIFSGQMDTGTD